MLSDVSSASQPLILVLLHFLAAQQSNEQSNPFSNLFLLLYSFKEVMTLEIASPEGMTGPDPEPHYTRVCLSWFLQTAIAVQSTVWFQIHSLALLMSPLRSCYYKQPPDEFCQIEGAGTEAQTLTICITRLNLLNSLQQEQHSWEHLTLLGHVPWAIFVSCCLWGAYSLGGSCRLDVPKG